MRASRATADVERVQAPLPAPDANGCQTEGAGGGVLRGTGTTSYTGCKAVRRYPERRQWLEDNYSNGNV